MKHSFITLAAAAALLGPLALCLRAEGGMIDVRVSVKIILSSTGAKPTNGLGVVTVEELIQNEITHGNDVLTKTGRGYRLLLLPIQYVQPPAPAEEDKDFWFNLPARGDQARSFLELAALNSQITWKWNHQAINFYVNNTNSGQCSFPGTGDSIFIGTNIGKGTVVHEIGHYFDLKHTHDGDASDPRPPETTIFSLSDLKDGDGFPETANDNSNIRRIDQLSNAIYGQPYDLLNSNQQANVNSAWQNVMSYHEENVLLPVQMNNWTNNANKDRRYAVSGWTRYVTTYGTDIAPFPFLFNDGIHTNLPLRTLTRAVSNAAAANDGDEIILMGEGRYNEPMTINTPVTLRAFLGNTVVIGKP